MQLILTEPLPLVPPSCACGGVFPLPFSVRSGVITAEQKVKGTRLQLSFEHCRACKPAISYTIIIIIIITAIIVFNLPGAELISYGLRVPRRQQLPGHCSSGETKICARIRPLIITTNTLHREFSSFILLFRFCSSFL